MQIFDLIIDMQNVKDLIFARVSDTEIEFTKVTTRMASVYSRNTFSNLGYLEKNIFIHGVNNANDLCD